MKNKYSSGGVSVGPTIAWATLEPDEWSPWRDYERSEYDNAKPINYDEEEEFDEDEEAEEEG